jgi:Na+/melibiose symporter-like transporter
VINSILQVTSKIGYALAGSVISFVLFLTSYVPNIEQTALSLWGIRACFVVFSLLLSLASACFAFLSLCDPKESLAAASQAWREKNMAPVLRRILLNRTVDDKASLK